VNTRIDYLLGWGTENDGGWFGAPVVMKF